MSSNLVSVQNTGVEVVFMARLRFNLLRVLAVATSRPELFVARFLSRTVGVVMAAREIDVLRLEC